MSQNDQKDKLNSLQRSAEKLQEAARQEVAQWWRIATMDTPELRDEVPFYVVLEAYDAGRREGISSALNSAVAAVAENEEALVGRISQLGPVMSW